MSQSEARSVFQDSRGYLWVGTAGGGVNKFDGTAFEEYSHKQGLEGTIITAIAEDSLGNMWFASSNAGVSRYDGKTFSQYGRSRGLGSNAVFSLLALKDRLLIGTEDGLYEFNIQNEVLRKIANAVNVTALHRDASGSIWVGAENALYELSGDKLTAIAFAPGTVQHSVTSISSDRGGLLFLGFNVGLRIYRPSTKTWSDNGLTALLSDKYVSCITNDAAGDIWIGTHNNLIVRYDAKSIITTYDKTNGLLADKVHMIVEDDTRHIWIATTEQCVIKLRGEAFTYYGDESGMGSFSVFRIFEDHAGSIWIGSSSDGLCKYNGEVSKPVLNGMVPFKQPVAVCEDSSKNIWVGHFSGVTCLVNDRPVKTLLSGLRVRALCADSKGNLWFGTWGNGLFKYDGANLVNYNTKDGSLPQDYIHDIFEDSRGNIWLGTGAGIVKYDGTKFVTLLDKQFCNSYVGSIKEDKQGSIWFHTDLCVMRFDGTQFYSYDQDDGLASNTVYLIEFDDAGRLWVGTNKGLDCVTLNGTSQFVSVRNYSRNEGFRGIECNSRAVCCTRAGVLWFGTVKGVISYSAENDMQDLAKPDVHLTGVRLFLEKTDWTWSGARPNGWYQLPTELLLQNDNNHLTFIYEGIHLQSPGNIRYKFMLVGFDSIWQPVTTQTEITYSNLPPGEYQFKVIAGNAEGVWNEEAAESCKITILPIPTPFWATWWFVLLMIVIFGIGLYYITVLRNRIVYRQKEVLEEEIRIRTLVISKQNEEKSLMLKEIHHRVKNNLQIISSLLNLHAETISDQRVLSLFEDLRHRVNSMALIHQKMYQSKNLVSIDMAGYIDDLIHSLIDAYHSDTIIRIKADVSEIEFNMDTIVPLGLILSEIISNSLKYAFDGLDDGEIAVSMKKIGPNLFALDVSDNGNGLPKGVNFEKTESLGMLLIRMLSEQINGEVTVRSDGGTKYRLVFREEVKERF